MVKRISFRLSKTVRSDRFWKILLTNASEIEPFQQFTIDFLEKLFIFFIKTAQSADLRHVPEG